MISLGRILLSNSYFACLSDGGKYRALDLAFIVSDPRCMVSPKREKWSLSSCIAWFSSDLD